MSPKLGLWVVLLFALALRLGMVLHAGERPVAGDEITYDSIALNVSEGRGFQLGNTDADRHPTAMRGPAYVLFVAAFYKLAGHRLVPPLAAQALLDVLSCWLVYRLAGRWFEGRAPALLAAALFAVYPPFVMSCAQLMTETLTTATVLLAVLAFFAWLDRPGPARLALAGLALGVCTLGKPQLGAAGVALAIAALPRLGVRRAASAAVVLTVVTAAVLAPWIVRNQRVLHAFVPGVTLGGISFWGGTAPIHDRLTGGLGEAWVPDSLRQALGRLSEVEASRWFYRDGLRVIAADPPRYALLTVRKVFQLWFNLLFDDPPSRASVLLALAHLGAFALAGIGMLRARPDPIATRVVLAMVVYWTLLHVPFVAQARYALPCLALVFVFTAAGASRFPPFARSGPRIAVPSA